MLDVNRIYMTGIHSIYQNIPHPKIFTYDGHACVHICDVIEHMVDHGITFDNISLEPDVEESSTCTATNIIDTPAAHALGAQVKNVFQIIP